MKPRTLLYLTVAALLSGCLSRKDTTRYYVLSAPPPAALGVKTGRPYLVGLRITSADYLRSREMIVESGPNQLRLSAENRWEEAPQSGFARVVSERLAQDVPDCDLAALPLTSTNTPEFSLEIDLQSLQGRLTPASEAQVSAELRVVDAHGRLLERDQFNKTSPWNIGSAFGSYSSLATAESQATAAVADEVAKKIMDYHRKMAGR